MTVLRTSDFNIKYFDFVVRADGKGTHQTIAEAMLAASLLPGQQCVFVSPGIYNEDLFLYSNVSLLSLGVPATRVLEEGGVGETATPLDGIIPDLAEPIIRGNHIIFYNVDEMGDVVRAHSVVYNSIRFESANVDKPIINLHNTSQTVNSIIYNSVIEFKDCTISQLEIGIPSVYQVVLCPSSTMFSRLHVEFNKCFFLLSSPDTFYLASSANVEAAMNSFVFRDCNIINFADPETCYSTIDNSNLQFFNCEISPQSYLFNSQNRDSFFLAQDTILRSYNQYMFIETTDGGDGTTEISLNRCQLVTADAPGPTVKEYFYSDLQTMNVSVTNCDFLNRPTNLYNGFINLSITETDSTKPIYCVYSDNGHQTAAAINTAYPIQFNTLEEGYGITVENDGQGTPKPTKITFQYPGVYNLQFSAQIQRDAGSGTKDINIWLRKNGENGTFNVPRTDTKITMSGNAQSAKAVAAWNLMFTASANDFVQLVWATEDTGLTLEASAADTTIGQERPAVPSVILTVYKVR